MSCWNGIELDTPASILKDGNDHYEPGTDVFAEIMDTAIGTFDNEQLFVKALWWRYRNFIIGACDTEFWVQGMADRLDMVGRRWDEIFSKMLDTDLTDLTDKAFHRLIKHTAIEGTEGDVRIITREGTDTNVNSKTGHDTDELVRTGKDTLTKTGTDTLVKSGTDTKVNSKTGYDEHTTEHETLPQTLTTTTKYLDSRQTDKDTPGVETTDETTYDTTDETTHDTTDETTYNTTDEDAHDTRDTRTVTPGVETTDELTRDLTDTDKFVPNTQDAEDYEEYDTLNAVTFSDMVKAYPNVFIDFTNEFSEYFVARWYRCRLVRYRSISSRAGYPAGNTL